MVEIKTAARWRTPLPELPEEELRRLLGVHREGWNSFTTGRQPGEYAPDGEHDAWQAEGEFYAVGIRELEAEFARRELALPEDPYDDL